MENIASGDVAAAVLSFDIIIQKNVIESLHFNVVLICDAGGFYEKIDAGVLEEVAGGEWALSQWDFLPGADFAAAGEGFVLVAGEGVDAVIIFAVFEHSPLHAGGVVDKCPDGKIAAHGGILVAPQGAVAHAAGVIGQALGNPDGGFRGVGGCGDDLIGIGAGLVAGQGGFDFHIQGGAVVHVTGVQGAQQEVPGFFRGVGAGSRGADLGNPDHGGLIGGGFNPIGGGCDDGPVPLIFGPSAGNVEFPLLIDQGPVPVDELG